MIRIELLANGIPVPGSAMELPWDTLPPGSYVCYNPDTERMRDALPEDATEHMIWPSWLDVSVRCLPEPEPAAAG